MPKLGLERHVVDQRVYDRTLARFADAGIVLPTFSQMAEPSLAPPAVRERLAGVDPDAPHPLNLFRVHWFNAADRKGQVGVAAHMVLPSSLTGVRAPIVVALGDRFPMIHAHKVLAAYSCLVPRIVTGQFDPTTHKAIWPSTGNYCRGGVAISRILGCRGVAVLPEGMSAERFQWLDQWVTDRADIIRTPGSESNVKEIYDTCRELDRHAENVIFNQFCEFGNHLGHYACTGRALAGIADTLQREQPALSIAAYVSATGSAGALGAGDFLKEAHGARIVAVEALECPTLLYNGFGEHNIQGIGDKHVPFIHNVMNTDFVVAVSDRATDNLGVLFTTEAGRQYLATRRGVDARTIAGLPSVGLSGICNIVAAIKVAKYLDLDERQAVMTIATDGAALYESEHGKAARKFFPRGFDAVGAGEVFGQYLAGAATDHVLELGSRERERIFNLGYYTWVEQQGVSIDEFQARRAPAFWRGLRDLLPEWDRMIDEFNARSGALARVS